MKTLFVIVLVGCLGAVSGAADVPTLKADHKLDTERQLRNLEREWNQAFKDRDKKALAALCSEDFLTTDDEGKVSDKAHFLEDATTHARVNSYLLSDLTARSYGDTGIVSGQWTGTITSDGEESKMAFRFTDTFIRRDGRWWAVASQMTQVGQSDTDN